MSLPLIAPLLFVCLGLAAGALLSSKTRPSVAVRVLTTSIVAATTGAAAAVLLVALAAASELRAVSDALGWCRALYPGDHGAGPWAGLIAATLLAVAAWRALVQDERWRHDASAFGRVDGVRVVPMAGAIAYAVPGRHGGIVLGDQLLRSLDAEERRVVLAHERAHLDLHHHRYLRTAEACAAALPLLRPLARRIRFETERWADEAAAANLGSRLPVARTIAKVALLGRAENRPLLAFGGGQVMARVDAMVNPPTTTPLIAFALATATIVGTATGSWVQLHHLAEFVIHACGS